MDLNMPGVGGLEATRQIAGGQSGARILILTVSQEEEDVVEAVLAGASGYVTKDGPVNDLIEGIRALSLGRSFVSPKIAPLLLQRADAAGDSVPFAARLSSAERSVLVLLAQSRTTEEAADELKMRPAQFRSVLAGILLKLQAQNRAQAAVGAVRDRIV